MNTNVRWKIVQNPMQKRLDIYALSTYNYDIKNNKGSVRVTQGDNVVCRAEVFSGLHSNGELMIKTRGNARCSDGSRYPLPEISCKAGEGSVAQCTARYDEKTLLPLTFKKASA